MNGNRNREISAVNAESFVRRKGEREIRTRRIFDLAQNDIGGQVHLESCGNQVLRFRRVGVDVKTGAHTEIQVYFRLRGAGGDDQGHWRNGNGRRLGHLRPRAGGEREYYRELSHSSYKSSHTFHTRAIPRSFVLSFLRPELLLQLLWPWPQERRPLARSALFLLCLSSPPL